MTYADKCAGNICHIPEPGEPDNVWWLGFDCGHTWDFSPGMFRPSGPTPNEVYRNIAYVKAQCELLAQQLKK